MNADVADKTRRGPYRVERRPLMRTVHLLLPLFVSAVAAGSLSLKATAAELSASKLAPTTRMELDMERMRQALNALDVEMEGVSMNADAATRRSLMQAHLARLRELIASMQAMEAQMHDAVNQGRIAADRNARARHEFLLEHMTQTVSLIETTLADLPAPETQE